MNKKILKKAVSVLLSLSMMSSLGVTAFAGEADGLGITWPTAWKEGTPPAWALEATEKEQMDTVAAITAEYDRQRENGFNMGTPQAAEISAWGNMVGVQFNGGDNTGNPWNHEGRKVGIIAAPYAGIAFSVKAYFGAHLGADTQPLSNQFEYTNPADGTTKVYQVFTGSQAHHNVDGSAYEVAALYPGSGAANNSIENVFKYTYASTAYGTTTAAGMNLGFAASNVVTTTDGIVYQEFLGSVSDGRSAQSNRGADKAFGISYIVMPNQNGDTAYVVTDKMLTAWATTWGDLDTDKPDLFAVTGAPTGNQYTDKDGVLCQDFENVTISLTDPKNPTRPTIISSDCEMKDFTVGDNFVYAYDDKIEVYVTDGSDITKLAPTFILSKNATATPESGSVHDFSKPVTYKVKAESGQEETFTVTVETANITDADRAACADFSSVYNTIGDEASYYDKETIEGLIDRYNAMSVQCKYLLKDEVPKFKYLQSDFNDIYENPIKIAFIGDSITSGNSYANRVATALKEAGLPIDARNFGVSGKCLSPNSDEPYYSTGRYLDSVAFEPDYVFILLGTNDSKPRNWEGTRNVKNTFEQDVKEMIEIYRTLPSKPEGIIGTSPKSYDVELNKQVDSILNANIEKIIEIQKKVAAEMNCPVIDVNTFTLNHVEWFPDAVHPSDVGHNAIRDFYLEYLYDMMDADLESITVNGSAVAGFDPAKRSYIVDDDIASATVEATTGDEDKDENVSIEFIIEGSENRYCAITVKSPLKYFSKTYVVNFTGDVEHTDADAKAAKAVEDMIAKLGDITTISQEKDVTAAREAYAKLTFTQQSLVENMAVLKAAESAVQALKDEDAAAKVEALIDALPEAKNITVAEHQTAIEKAKSEYDKLTKVQKDLIPGAKASKLNSTLTVLDDLLNPYIKYEAEAAKLNGAAASAAGADCSGGQYISNIGGDAGAANRGSIDFTVNMAHAATTELTIYYATGMDRTLEYTVNGETKSINCPNSGGWDVPTAVSVTVFLKAGDNTVTLAHSTNWAPNIDCIEVAKATEKTKTDTANAVAELINKLPNNIGLSSKRAVEAANTAYMQLSGEQKNMIADEGKKLADAIETIDRIENPDKYPPEKPVVKGDLTNDGKVTVSDILALKTIIMSGKAPTAEQLEIADLNASPDGKLTVSDILGIKAIIMG